MTTHAEGRVNVGRVSHIVLIYSNRENRDAALQQYSAVLGVDDWLVLGELYDRVDVVISYASGLELVFPTREGTAFADHIATKGEGLFSFVYGVDDLDEGMADARAQGLKAVPFPPMPEAVRARFAVAREAGLGEVGGTQLVLGEFQPRADHP